MKQASIALSSLVIDGEGIRIGGSMTLMCAHTENCAFNMVNNDFEIEGITPLLQAFEWV